MIKQIQLGDKVKDPITGIVGIAVAKTKWIYGCNRVTIQPEGSDKDKKPYDTLTVDEPQLLVIKSKQIKMVKTKNKNSSGGPTPTPVGKKNVAIK